MMTRLFFLSAILGTVLLGNAHAQTKSAVKSKPSTTKIYSEAKTLFGEVT